MRTTARRIAPIALTAALALGTAACAESDTPDDVITTEDDGMTDDSMTDDGMSDDSMTESDG